MKFYSLALLAACALVVAPSVATAGGAPAPGAKNQATLRITNGTNNAATNNNWAATNATIVAAVNPSPQLQQLAATAGTNLAALQNLAAQQGTQLVVLGPGGAINLNERPNTNVQVGVVEINPNTGIVIPASVNLGNVFQIKNGATRTVNLVQNGAGTAIQFQTSN